MARATINGIEIDHDAGGSGPAVLLTHGYSATGHMWNGQRAALEERYRLITWDMRGHGRTIAPDDPAAYSHEQTVSDMAGLLDLFGVRTAVIGGLSLGGFMSLKFFQVHRDRVRALVICDSGPGYRDPKARAAWNDRAEKTALDLEERGLDVLAERTPEMREAAARHRSAAGLALAARGMLAQKDSSVIDSLAQIDVPTLIIVGAEDEPFLAPSQYMEYKIAGARLETIEGAGHAANFDRPEAFNRVLLDFLDSLPAES